MRRRPSSAGFTLVELMVSLVAGLIIAVAVVGLARAATTTFHEQARISAVEASARTAAERLRSDLLRVSFMSTGNIHLASRSDSVPPVPFGMRVANNVGSTTTRYPNLANLQGLRILVGESNAASQIPTSGSGVFGTSNGLDPDAIVITGNLTTDDSYEGIWTGAGDCTGARIRLSRAADPAVARLLSAASPIDALRNAFTPVAGHDYIARVVDTRNCEHYVPVCGVGLDGVDAYVDLRPASDGLAILPPRNDSTVNGAGNCGGTETERFTISPVHRVRWYVGPNLDPLLEPDTALEPPGSKLNLYREMIDANGAPLFDPPRPEIVAEYAIDLKFGIVVDDPDPSALPPSNVKVFDLDTDNGSGLISSWTRPASTTVPAGPGPQRVRSVRFRIATRAPLSDRTQNLVVNPAAPRYLARYCVNPPACTRYARVRTIVSEVALINQAAMSY